MDARVDSLCRFFADSAAKAMRGLPVFNPRLQVEAVDFRERAGRFSGILITPWCMNLVLFAGEDDNWDTLPPGRTVAIDFPAGREICLPSVQENLEKHLSLPLFTTMMHFDSQDMARQVAADVLEKIYRLDAPAADEEDSHHTLSRRTLLFGLGQNADA